jgi:hypothetical protein
VSCDIDIDNITKYVFHSIGLNAKVTSNRNHHQSVEGMSMTIYLFTLTTYVQCKYNSNHIYNLKISSTNILWKIKGNQTNEINFNMYFLSPNVSKMLSFKHVINMKVFMRCFAFFSYVWGLWMIYLQHMSIWISHIANAYYHR